MSPTIEKTFTEQFINIESNRAAAILYLALQHSSLDVEEQNVFGSLVV